MLALLQASLQSQRFPSKVMEPIGGTPMVLLAARRIRKARCVSDLVVSVPTEPADNPLAAMLQQRGFRVIRAVPKNQIYNLLPVIEKAGYAGRWFFRFTADNPCVDPALIEAVREEWQKDKAQAQVYLTRSDRLRGNDYPNGYDVELIQGRCLRDGIEYNPALLHWQRLSCPLVIQNLSVTVDTPQDLERVRAIYRICDGDASFARIAKRIQSRIFRPAHRYNLGDFLFLRSLRNRVGPGHIPLLDHWEWWRAGGWRKCFLALMRRQRIGYVRESALKEISIAVHSDYQHLGIGLFLLRSLPTSKVPRYAYVRTDNATSLALFRKAGWIPQEQGPHDIGGFLRFEERHGILGE